MTDNLIIRKATLEDADNLVSISLKTYFETFFKAFNDDRSYQAYVADIFSADRLKATVLSIGCKAIINSKIPFYSL